MSAADDFNDFNDAIADAIASAFASAAEAKPIPYTDEGFDVITDACAAAVDKLTPEQRQYLRDAAEAMSPDDWDVFADVAIRPVRPEDLLEMRTDED